MKIDEKMASIGWKGGVHLLCVIGNKVIHEAQTHGRGARQNRKKFFQVPRYRVKFLEPRDDMILLTLDAILDGRGTTFKRSWCGHSIGGYGSIDLDRC